MQPVDVFPQVFFSDANRNYVCQLRVKNSGISKNMTKSDTAVRLYRAADFTLPDEPLISHYLH